MNIFRALSPVIPVFILIATGFIFGIFKKINLSSVTEIIVYLGTPSLVFSSLAGKPLFLNDITSLFLGVIIMFGTVGLLIKSYFLASGFSSRGFALPVLFMNAGNMGIPLALFAFGAQGMQRATLMFVIITMLQYTLGIYLLNGRGNWKETFRLPLIYAAVAGLTVNLTALRIPELLLQPFSLLGQATIPIMLISLGYRLSDVRSLKWGHALGGGLLRIFGGSASAFAAVNIIGAEGMNRQVLLLYGCLPAAVVNFILTEKYRQDPEIAASIVVLSTFISVFTIPLMFWIIL